MSLNVVTMTGHLVKDADVVDFPGGKIAKFAIANNHYNGSSTEENKKEVSFFDCQLFGKRVDSVSQYLTKGKQIALKGRLKQDRWVTKDSNEARSRIVITIEDFEFLSGGLKNAQVDSDTTNEKPTSVKADTKTNVKQLKDSEIPF